MNKNFKVFLKNWLKSHTFGGKCLKFKKKPLHFEKKLNDFEKKTQCYGVFKTQCDSLKSVKKKACIKKAQDLV